MGSCNTKEKIEKVTYNPQISFVSDKYLNFECILSNINFRNLDSILSTKDLSICFLTTDNFLLKTPIRKSKKSMKAEIEKLKDKQFRFSIKEQNIFNHFLIVVA